MGGLTRSEEGSIRTINGVLPGGTDIKEKGTKIEDRRIGNSKSSLQRHFGRLRGGGGGSE